MVYGPSGVGSSVCAADRRGNCRGDLELIFFGPVRDLSFSLTDTRSNSVASLATYGEDGLGAQRDIPVNGLTPVSPTGKVSRASVSWPSGAGGVSGLSFIPDTDAPVGPDQASQASLDAPASQSTASTSGPGALRFDQLGYSGVTASSIDLGDAIITHADGGEFFIYEPNEYGIHEYGGFCALDPGFYCTADFTVTFRQLVSDLSFEAFFVGATDLANVSIWLGTELLGTSVIS